MAITVTDLNAATVAVASQVDQRATAGSLLSVPRFGGLGCLSTDLLTGEKMSHPRTSVRGEGRRT
jgi:hypothetical protein